MSLEDDLALIRKGSRKPAPSVAPTGPTPVGSRFAGAKTTGTATIATPVEDYESHNWFTDILDDAWMDDFSRVPVLGAGASATAKTYQQATDLISQTASFTNAALPGGIGALSWHEASQVSFGQVAVANASRYGWTVLNAFGYDASALPDAPAWAQPDFNINSVEQRRAAFEEDTFGRVASGLNDAAFSWYMDPLVIAGKGVKVARLGSDFLAVRGLASASTNLPSVVDDIGRGADDALKFIASNGAEGVDNAVLVAGRHVAKSTTSQLREWAPVNSSPYKDTLAGILGNIHDDRLGVIAYAAATGNQRYMGLLRAESQGVADAIQNATRSLNYEKAFVAGVFGRTDTGFVDDVLEEGFSASAIMDDLVARNAALKDAIAFYDTTIAPITRVSSRSPGFERVRAVWSAGRANRDLPKSVRQGVASDARASKASLAPALDEAAARGLFDTPTSTTGEGLVGAIKAGLPGTGRVIDEGPAIVEHTFQLSSGFRKVRLWAWASGQRSSGWASIRGLDDGNSAVDELLSMVGDSRTVRKDGVFKQWVTDTWTGARTSSERWAATEEIERATVRRIAAAHGVDEDLLLDQYAWIARRRNAVKAKIGDRNKSAFGVDEDGALLSAHPNLVSQLESRVPLLDMRLMEETARRLGSHPVYSKAHDAIRKALLADNGKAAVSEVQHIGESGAETAVRWMDEMNSIWKASVLMRLGYPQRNVAEGWLRSWATLGTVPALRPVVAARGARNVYWNAGRGAKLHTVDDVQKNIGQWITEQRLVIKQIDDDLAIAADRAPEWVAGLKSARATAEQSVTDFQAMSQKWDGYRATLGKRYIGDDAAFAGELGEVRRAGASNSRSVQNFFESRADRDLLTRMSERSWEKIDPSDEHYFQELANTVKQFTSDPMTAKFVRGDSLDDVHAWARSREGNAWARELDLYTPELRSAQVDFMYEMFNRYFPSQAARDLIKSTPTPTGGQLKNLLPDPSVLSPVHGREVMSALEAGGRGKFRQGLAWFFEHLGSMPESALVRQPFYNEVWKRETAALSRLAESQGLNLLDDAVSAKILDAAHRRALSATNETLFTIVRYSNPAAALRFLSPFFAAWENSMRTWGRIVKNDPSVLARASMLWNVPASMGLVYDTQTGEKIEASPFSFLNVNPNAAMVLPGELGRLIAAAAGGIESVVPLSSLNVVTPGESPFLPGFNAPLAAVPLGNILAQKPDWQQWLKDHVGETVYNQFISFGEAKGGVGGFVDVAVPAAARKFYSMVRGEDNLAYMQVLGSMTQSALVDQNLGVEKFDAKKVLDRANQFFLFSTLGSLTLPAALMRTSKYQTELDIWHNITADDSLTFTQKLDLFRSKVGDAYMPLTRSTTMSQAPNIAPTLESWNAIIGNEPIVKSLISNFGPEAAGIIGATAPDGEFNRGSYNYWLSQSMPGTDGNWKSKMNPEQIAMQGEVSSMWADYSAAKALRDNKLAQLGVKSIRSKASIENGVTAQWDDFKARMLTRYGDAWTAYGPDSFAPYVGTALAAVRFALSDKKFRESELGRSKTWLAIGTYIYVRDQATDAIARGEDGAYVRDQWDQWRYDYRDTDVKFADFFDQYLDGDDLQVDVGTVN